MRTAVGPSGGILWLTGLSGSGKSTLATRVGTRLGSRRPVEILDGDEVRTNLSSGLGFTKEDRDRNIRSIGFVARLLARHGVLAVAAAISPYAAVREEMRRLAGTEDIPFVEVFVSARIESLIARDVKGLYRRALAGEIPHFTGVSDPYEEPESPDLTVFTDRESIETSTEKILAVLASRGLAPQSPSV